jgi:hypothetical protein
MTPLGFSRVGLFVAKCLLLPGRSARQRLRMSKWAKLSWSLSPGPTVASPILLASRFTAGSKGGPQELFSQLCALVHSEVQSASSYKNLKGNFMTHYLNMHTVRVATVVTFGVVLGLLMVSSLRAGFLLALAENAMVRPEPVYPVAAEDGRSLSDIICPNPLRLRTLLPERSGFCS